MISSFFYTKFWTYFLDRSPFGENKRIIFIAVKLFGSINVTS